jgi:putative glycosyltransferase (TIGR04348 family)
MKIQLVTPAPLNLDNGNKITALRWAAMLKQLGHRVNVAQHYDAESCDLLIALHARRSAESIQRFHKLHPDLPLIVVLTGTDLYRDIQTDRKSKQSLELATRLVVLQRMALAELPKHLHPKTLVIYQSAEPCRARPSSRGKTFNVCVIGHLREEKDPLRTALAVRRLPCDSRILVTHIGTALNDHLGERARAEAKSNPRYRWLGMLSHRKTREVLAASHLTCITSKIEGSSNVLSEALACGVPVIASKISGLMGTLGESFPGYFSVGNTEQLAKLLSRTETDSDFYRSLKNQCARVAKLVQPKRELAEWKRLLQELT